MRLISLLVVMALSSLEACRKNDNNFYLQGGIYHADDEIAMPDVRLTVYKQVLQNGIFGSSYSIATSTTTNSNGLYNLTWERENFAELKLIAERNQYVTREIIMDPDDFAPGEIVLKNLEMYTEAFISVRILNTGVSSATDRCLFTFLNANFDCACCSNGWREFQGADIDSTFSCRIYGNRWLKYQRNLGAAEVDSVLVDSIWCPAFQTTDLVLEH